MKNFLNLVCLLLKQHQKKLIVMRNTVLILLISALQVFAADGYAQSKKISLAMNDATIREVLYAIQNQSEFYFLYNSELIDVARKVDITIEEEKVDAILTRLFNKNEVDFLIKDRYIVLTPVGGKAELFAEQQQNTVSGRVTDSGGQPLPGVTVVIKGTTQGTVTNADGDYSFTNIPEDATLQFSFVGMRTQEVVVGNQMVINITMEIDAIGLEEVVAVGYGVKKKVNLTGALSSVGSEKLESITTSNFVNGLAGKLPGLRVTQRSGEPGSYSTAFDIRGLGSPLIIVDGIKRDDFTRIDPKDIEDITIIKDGSAAIYGVEAANGVVLVTTKKGNIGKPVISYSGSYDFQKFTVDPEVTNAYQFAVLTVENEIAQGQNPNSTTYSPADIQNFKDGTYPSTDWLGVIQKDYTSVMHHNINISGGNEKVKYYTSLGYLNEDGIWKSDNLYYKKYNLRSSLSVDITENLKAQLNMEGMLEERNNTSLTADNIYFTAMLAQPTTPLYANDNPDYLHLVNPENVLADISSDHSGYHRTNTKTFQSNLTLDYKFKNIEGLSAKYMYGFFNRDLFEKAWRKLYHVYTYDQINDKYNVAGSGKWTPTQLYENYTPFQRSTLLGQLLYEKLFNQKHNIGATLVYEARHTKNDNLHGNKYFDLDVVDQLFAGVAENATINSANIEEYANQSLIGRFNYDYLSRYLMEFGFNYGGSSKFAKEKRWGFFPFTSVGWRISEEEFFKNSAVQGIFFN
ncbi:MAG: SusC/RagA family TonB-linked outer membrane protein [Mariniphaga sp.]|nr:SusC/RagA family TonB-linked outer membrane protein [Mariniphaga sp.]